MKKLAPYQSVYEKLKEIREHRHPIKKIKVIYEAKKLISLSVDTHLARVGHDTLVKKECLDAEQVTFILAFAVMKSGITEIVAHIQHIEDFTTAAMQESHLGQALVSLKNATRLLITK